MFQKRELKKSLIIFFKGGLMGIAHIIPGVSGGTIALITGIYKQVIYALSRLSFKFIFYFLKGRFKQVKQEINKIDFKLFVPLILGIVLAVLLVVRPMHFLLQKFPSPTYAFFFGLIGGSAIFIYKKIPHSAINVLFLIAGFLFAFLSLGLTNFQIEPSLFVLFISGIVAAAAMILPGISGAFILLFLGQYEYIIFIMRNLYLLELFIFLLGVLIGILSFSKIINYLLKKYEFFIISFLVGLMGGSLRLLYREINIAENINLILPVSIWLLIGFFIIFVIESNFVRDKLLLAIVRRFRRLISNRVN